MKAAILLRVSADEKSTEKSSGASLWRSPSAGPTGNQGDPKVFVGGASAITPPLGDADAARNEGMTLPRRTRIYQ